MLRLEQHVAQQLQICRVAHLQRAFCNPRFAQARQLAKARHLEWIAGAAVNPGIADFFSHHRQLVAEGSKSICHFAQIRGYDFRIRKPSRKIRMNAVDLFRLVRAAVIAAHARDQRQIRSGNHRDGLVFVVIHHGQTRARGILPQEKRRQHSGGRSAVHADFEKGNAVLRQWRNDAARVSGHVGHLGAGGHFAEAPVERLRQCQTALNHRRAQHLRLPCERQRVPRNVAARNRLFHRLAFGGLSLLQILEEQPRSGSPHVAPLALGVRGARSLNGLRKVLIEVFMNDVVLRIDKAGIEVTLEHHQHALHPRIGSRRLRSRQ